MLLRARKMPLPLPACRKGGDGVRTCHHHVRPMGRPAWFWPLVVTLAAMGFLCIEMAKMRHAQLHPYERAAVRRPALIAYK